MLKKSLLYITIIYSLALLAVSLMTLHDLPDLGVSFADKIFHFLAYTVLTVLWYGTFSYTLNYRNKRAISYAMLFSIVFGIIIEVLQGCLTTSRRLDFYDIIANTIGTLLVSFVLWLILNFRVKNL